MVSTGASRYRTVADGSGRPIAFLVSTTGCARDIQRHMGSADYSYTFVLKALEPVLEQFGTWKPIGSPESSLIYQAERAWEQGYRPIHLSVQPPQCAYLTPAVPTVMFPFWEFPRIPDREFGHDTRQNWLRMGSHADLILTACHFTAAAFRRAGVTCPVAVVPVPLAPSTFEVPAWDPAASWTLNCRHLVLCGRVDPPPATPAAGPDAPPAPRPSLMMRGVEAGYKRMKVRYMRHLRHWISEEGNHRIYCMKNTLLRRTVGPLPLPVLPRTPLTLDGLVYTSIFNLGDRRKNIEDMLTAFLLAFHDRPDVTLVLKLATNDSREFHELNHLRHLFGFLNLRPACRLVVVTDFLSDEQMDGLMGATTYYVNTSKAEGACLPLQQALAAGRPALAPGHTAMADYMDDGVGFLLPSHPEPTHWPHDPEHRFHTTWNRLVWSELRDRFLQSAAIADDDRAQYDGLSAAARARMTRLATRAAAADALRRALRLLPATRPGARSWAA
jgi:glycosyltransferase involved in cell wall biosynthesis